MKKQAMAVVCSMLACGSVLAHAPLVPTHDDDGNPIRLLGYVENAPRIAVSDDDGNPLVLLPANQASVEVAARLVGFEALQ